MNLLQGRAAMAAGESSFRTVVLGIVIAMAACVPADVSRPPTVGEAMPPLALPGTDGDTVSLADLEGRVVLVNLWATWCVPCRTETPLLQNTYEEQVDRGLTIVGVNLDGPGARGSVDRFLEQYGVTYPQLLDPQMGTMDRFGVFGLPATYLVDRSGTVRFVRIGPILERDPTFWGALDAALMDGAVATGTVGG